MPPKKNEIAKQIEWKYDDQGNAVAIIPDGYVAETVEEAGDFQVWSNIGDSISGVFLGAEDMTIQDSDTFKYSFQVGPDPAVDVRSCHGTMDLDGKMSVVGVGEYVTVKLVESKRTQSGNTFKVFDVTKMVLPA